VEAVQQSLGLDVGVQERHRAADLRQAEPGAQEVGLVVHEQGDAVPFAQLRRLQEHVGEPVAAQLHVPVRVHASFVDEERLERNAPRLLDEPVQHRAHAARQPGGELQPHAVTHHLQQEKEVPPKVREAEGLQDVSAEKTRQQSREPPQRQRHVCGCQAAMGRVGWGCWGGGHGGDNPGRARGSLNTLLLQSRW